MRQQLYGLRPRAERDIPSFQANKNGTAQTGIVSATATKLTFPTEAWDTHGWYDAANSRYLPRIAGKYRFDASAYITANVVDTASKIIHFYKNGAAVKSIEDLISGANPQSAVGGATVDMNGTTDYVEAWITVTGASDKTVDGSAVLTWFEGHKI